MRIVCTSDTHFPFDKDKIPEGDVFIHTGDLMYNGYEAEWYPRLESLKALDHPIKILVPGNHDFHIQNYEGIAKAELRRVGVTLLGLGDKTDVYLPNGMSVGAMPYVTGLHGWAFNRQEEWIKEWLAYNIDNKDIDIMLTHAPIYGVLDAVHPERETRQDHVGGMAMNRWFYGLDVKPSHWIHGHIHESYGSTVVDGCNFHNVSMCDRAYKQSNACVILEVEG